MKSGIYLITNITNNRNYVGKSTNVNRRWSTHLTMLNNKEHHNEELQKDWDEYGEAYFTFKIIELCPEEMLSNRERHWIDMFNALDNGYNHNQRGKKKQESNKTKEDLESIMKLCKEHYEECAIGMIEINAACKKLNIRYEKMLILLTKLRKDHFDKYGIYVHRNWDMQNEYVCFCTWVDDSNEIEDYVFDYIDL